MQVSMNEMAEIVMDIGGKKLPIRHIPGPEGVRGRNSDNTLIKQARRSRRIHVNAGWP